MCLKSVCCLAPTKTWSMFCKHHLPNIHSKGALLMFFLFCFLYFFLNHKSQNYCKKSTTIGKKTGLVTFFQPLNLRQSSQKELATSPTVHLRKAQKCFWHLVKPLWEIELNMYTPEIWYRYQKWWFGKNLPPAANVAILASYVRFWGM